MNWKETVRKELEETRELADYVSEDPKATKPLREIRKTEVTLVAIKKPETFNRTSVIRKNKKGDKNND